MHDNTELHFSVKKFQITTFQEVHNKEVDDLRAVDCVYF